MTASNKCTFWLLIGAFESGSVLAQEPTETLGKRIEAATTLNIIMILADDQSWVGSSPQIIPDDPRTRSDDFQTPTSSASPRWKCASRRAMLPLRPAARHAAPSRFGQTPARHEYQADCVGWTAAYRQQLNIPRMLKAADPRYQTAHFGKWDHRYDEVSPHEQGYDFSDGYTGNGNGGSKGSGGSAASPDPKRIDTLTDTALHFIERHHAIGTPFYLPLSHYAVHLDIYYNQSTFDP